MIIAIILYSQSMLLINVSMILPAVQDLLDFMLFPHIPIV